MTTTAILSPVLSLNSAYASFFPEIWIAAIASIILLVDTFWKNFGRAASPLLAIAAIIVSLLLSANLVGSGSHILLDSFISDEISTFLKMAIDVIAIFVFLYSRKYIEQHKIIPGEYYVLCLFSILGMMILVSAYSLLTLYLGVELLALPLYALIAMAKGLRAPEAAMKYFVMGALASGLMLYGISLIYGITGSFEIKTVAAHIPAIPTTAENLQFTLLLGMIFTLSGLAFKLGAVPFHMWVPDVYEGSAASVTLFIGTLPEIAGFGMAIRLLLDTFPALAAYWQEFWIIIAISSLAIGNIAAIAQTNLKRMLAYSSISHIGFVVLGLLAGPDVGYGPALAYVIIYALMAAGAFGIMIALSHQGFEAENISDFRGLGKAQPWVAFLMLLILFSLAGVPPTIGFYAKFLVLNALIQAGYVWLAVVAVIFAVIGAYYYLRVVRVMFFDAPASPHHAFKEPPWQIVQGYGLGLLSVNGLLILALGIYPAPLINACLALFK